MERQSLVGNTIPGINVDKIYSTSFIKSQMHIKLNKCSAEIALSRMKLKSQPVLWLILKQQRNRGAVKTSVDPPHVLMPKSES